VFALLSFFFGASIGSFVSVVVTRLNVAPIMKTRSKCLSCGEALRTYDLIPVISYLLLRGRCRYCKTVFGISALAIEMLYGTVFLLLYHFILRGQSSLLIASLWLLYYTFLFGTLGVIALYDRIHTYIPIVYLMVYCVLTFGMLIMRYIQEPTSMTLLSPVVVALPFLLIWLISRGKALGFGDVLLFLGVGAFFGIASGFAVLLLSVWLGAIIGGGIYLLELRRGKANSAIPFVPFIVLAFVIVLFTDTDIFSIASLFA
jgi:prepilin signal peptidase PulO-like enzyme (type II secretory pathway)